MKGLLSVTSGFKTAGIRQQRLGPPGEKYLKYIK